MKVMGETGSPLQADCLFFIFTELDTVAIQTLKEALLVATAQESSIPLVNQTENKINTMALYN